MDITIRNRTVLRFCGFYATGPDAFATMPLRLWIKCLYWRLRNGA